MSVRLDKWLQVARVFKTRSQARRACLGGHVRVNSKTAKPHHPLVEGDRVEVRRERGWKRILLVKKIHDRSLPRRQARELFEDLSPPPPTEERWGAGVYPAARREKGAGRPTKRARRQLEQLKGGADHE